MRQAFVDRLTEIAARDSRVMLLTGDLGFNVLDKFAQRLPRQYLNVGVAEQNMAGVATGLALEGRIVFTYSIANFTFMRCLEQLRNDAAYHDCNVNVVSVGGGFSYGALGISHHATEDLSIMRALPGVTVVAPGDDWEAAEATEAIANSPGVAYLRLDRSGAAANQKPNERFRLGQARVLREGDDVTIVAVGGILDEVVQAADELAKCGVRSRVLSIHTVKPLDITTVSKAARDTGGIVTVEEHTIDGGLGGAVAESLLERGVVPGFFHRIGLRQGFSSVVGSQQYLRTHYQLDRNHIVSKVRELLKSHEARLRPRAA